MIFDRSHLLLILASALAAAVAIGHILLWKRDPKAAWGWIGFCLVFPILGPLAYFVFGINRIQTRARRLGTPIRRERVEITRGVAVSADLLPLKRISDAVAHQPLVDGNRIEVLHNGEGTYPAMLDAIRQAEASIRLSTYIFDGDETGQEFGDALAAAARRGVEVAVLIDAYGEIYSSPRAAKMLRARGLEVATFLPPSLLAPRWHLNIRTHRKILVVDDRIAFVGGLNIGDRHLADRDDPRRVVDLHFRLQGKVVAQLAAVFEEDWALSQGSKRLESRSTPSTEALVGDSLCRVIADGPNEDIDRLAMILNAAVSTARQRVAIMTPYFLPPRELIGSLQAAALRGVATTILLPGRNNLPYMHWATRHLLWEILQRGVDVRYQPPPFVHSKLFLIDDDYAIIGSSNIDPRSLRLNFEVAVEVIDRELVTSLWDHFDTCSAISRAVTLEEVDGRPLVERLRDGAAWLFSPYL